MIRIFNQYVSSKTIFLNGSEILLVAGALLAGILLRFGGNPPEASFYILTPAFPVQACIFVLAFQVSFHSCNVYKAGTLSASSEQWLRVWRALGVGSVLVSALQLVVPYLVVGEGVLLLSILLVSLFVIANRVLLNTAWQSAVPKQNLLIIGTQGLAQAVGRELARKADLNIKLAGFVSTDRGGYDGDSDLVLGSIDRLEAIASERHITRIVVALEDRRGSLPLNELVRLRMQGIPVEDAHSMLASLSGRIWLRTIQPSWFVFSEGFRRSRLTLILKRILDLGCGLFALAMSSWLMALIALAIRLDSKGPVIYRQRRVGLRGRPFDVLKFRSMRVDAEKFAGPQWAQEDDPRVTRVGRFLRKHRLDEFPQFINVIRGDMSFVGPRPERPEFVDQLRQDISYYDERHFVRPGLTGWAQVQYRYGATVDDARRKLEYDLFYMKNMSVLFDCAIILKTIRIVLGSDGVR